MQNSTSISPAAENYGDGSNQQNTPVTVNQESVKNNCLEQYYIFVPKNFDIDTLLKKNPPKFKYHKDYISYLVHLVSYGTTRKKGGDDFFVRIHSGLVQKRVRNYRIYLDYLVDSGVFLEDRYYIPKKQSRGIAFTTEYATEVKLSVITKKTLIKSINKFYNYENNEVSVHNEVNDLGNVTKWLNAKLKIDFNKAKLYLEELRLLDSKITYKTKEYNRLKNQPNFNLSNYRNHVAMMKYNSRMIPLIKLHKGLFYPSIDSTAGRLHTVLTQLKGDLRKFITYDGKPLIAIDIVNSQPYLSIALLNINKFEENNMMTRIKQHNKNYNKPYKHKHYPIMLVKMIQNSTSSPNIKEFIDFVCSGQFYERFGSELLRTGIIDQDSSISPRKQSKDATFSAMFSPNNLSNHLNSVISFNRVFPDVFNIFKLIKSGRNTHPTLACILQNLEADLILNKACKLISNEHPEIPIFTLHDSIITTSEHVEYVEYIMTKVLTESIGFPPKLKREEWVDAA